jgi:hypothetical protein
MGVVNRYLYNREKSWCFIRKIPDDVRHRRLSAYLDLTIAAAILKHWSETQPSID